MEPNNDEKRWSLEKIRLHRTKGRRENNSDDLNKGDTKPNLEVWQRN